MFSCPRFVIGTICWRWTFNYITPNNVMTARDTLGNWRLAVHVGIKTSLIERFMGPTWGSSGADRTQVGHMLAPWTLLSGIQDISITIDEHNAALLIVFFCWLYLFVQMTKFKDRMQFGQYSWNIAWWYFDILQLILRIRIALFCIKSSSNL